jgi:hypothetical protein
LRVEAYVALDVGGEVRLDDPDGIVVDAAWVPIDDCGAQLVGAHRWVVEPIVEWLTEPWEGRRSFGYDVLGDDASGLDVRRR